MNGNFFLDTNVIIYSIDDRTVSTKKQKALELLKEVGFVSPQVLFECISTCVRKLGLSKVATFAHINSLLLATILQPEDEQVFEIALRLFAKYNFQPFDSKIVAAALVAGCSTLYSEDMQHGLVVENSLTIVNPFL